MPLRKEPPKNEEVCNENEYGKSDCLAYLPHSSSSSIRFLHVEIAGFTAELLRWFHVYLYLNFLYKLI